MVKIYGVLAGIERDKLSLAALRLAAVDQFMESDTSLEELDAFLGSPGPAAARQFRYIVRLIRQCRPDPGFEPRLPASVRSRQPHNYTSQDSFKHGLYASRLPVEEINAILAEGIVGMKEETAGLETLMMGVMERLAKVKDEFRPTVALSDAHLMCSVRLMELIDFEYEAGGGLSEGDAQSVETIQKL